MRSKNPAGNRLNTTQTISRPNTSRSSLNSSMVSVTLYPRCNKKKQHAKEMMNLICLTPTCKNKGPICSMCKSSDHSGHTVQPIKSFLTKLLSNIKKSSQLQTTQSNMQKKNVMTEEEPIIMEQKIQESTVDNQQISKEDILKLLEGQKIQIFSLLSYYVNKIAVQIQKIEEKICQDYATLSNQISGLFQTQQNVANVVQQFLEEPPNDADQYSSQIRQLLNIIQIKQKDQFMIKSDFYEDKISKWKKKGQNFMGNIQFWAQNTFTQFQGIFQDNQHAKKGKKLDGQSKNNEFKFSAQNKMKSINVSGKDKVVKQSQKAIGLAVIDGPAIKGKKIKLKVKGLNTNIGFGVGLKDIIKSKTYKGNFSAIGHGTFLACNNTYIYSHHEKTSNMVMKGISFLNNEELTISVKTNGESVEIKKGDGKTVQLSLKKMTEAEWKQACFCVMLSGTGDSVEILDG